MLSSLATFNTSISILRTVPSCRGLGAVVSSLCNIHVLRDTCNSSYVARKPLLTNDSANKLQKVSQSANKYDICAKTSGMMNVFWEVYTSYKNFCFGEGNKLTKDKTKQSDTLRKCGFLSLEEVDF